MKLKFSLDHADVMAAAVEHVTRRMGIIDAKVTAQANVSSIVVEVTVDDYGRDLDVTFSKKKESDG